MEEFIKANKELWEERTLAHEKSEFYDIEGFLRGNQTLDPIELEEIGDVKGKSLLHLMCHFGLDTLSWGRLGADVTGVDIAENAIELARKLSKQIGMNARFIQSNVYKLPEKLDEQFDIVFMSGGVINWLPDMERLLQVAARYVKPGGFYYLREFHPFFWVFDDEIEQPILKVMYPYFQGKDPLHFESDTSYASDKKMKKLNQYEWGHTVSTILNSAVKAGLRIEFFNEFPFTSYKALMFLEEKGPLRWELPEGFVSLPMMFSLKAIKE